MGGFGPSCDRGNGSDGSSGSSSRLLRPPKLPSPLALAEPEPGLVVGSDIDRFPAYPAQRSSRGQNLFLAGNGA